MKCILDVTALQYLSVKVPKYQGKVVIQRNCTKNSPQEFVYKCKQCEKFYIKTSSLVLHQIVVHDLKKKVLQADTDESPFDTRDDIRLNLTKTDPFEQFLVEKQTKEHKIKSTLECTFCGKVLSTESARKVHERTQHKDGGHKCQYCGKYFPIKVNGITHEKRMHSQEENKRKPFKCQICEQGFAKEFNYDQHMKRHETGELELINTEQTCEICDNTYKSKRDLNRHFRRMHRSNMWISYTCQFCGKFFNRKSDGQVHERKVHRLLVEQNKDFKCHFCVRGFDTEKFRQMHEQNHKQGELNCKNCGKEFYYRAQCKSHEVVCGVGNLIDDDLQEHYVCHYCNKSFVRKGSLLPHFASHFPIFTFSCELCGRTFKRKEALKRHLIALHSEQRGSLIQCEICAKILSSMTALKRHQKQTHYMGKEIQDETRTNETEIQKKKINELKLVKEEEEDKEMFGVEEQDVAQTIEVYSVMIFP